jgi:bifunctional N-acetylglucosamine-1-phosphate-uridyltransferase/glucosamine-1-phosphate-acetyltransferase GlmU-like protein
MMRIDHYISSFSKYFEQHDRQPWNFISDLDKLIKDKITSLGKDYIIKDNMAIHKTAFIDENVILKAPIIIGDHCFVGANSYLRNGVFLANNVLIGTGCEVKSTLVFGHSAIAHFNFIGDSMIGQHVNFEAGSITANHFNERKDKTIFVKSHGLIINTKIQKFGSLVGDHSKIGANAVLSPGTILDKNSVVKRLELIEQIKG